MAPPSPFNTFYDQDIKKHVIEVRDQKTGLLQKFCYNQEYGRFEAAPLPVVVYEKDLEPIYQASCQRHSIIVFCKNKKLSGNIFKYRIGDSRGPWQRVQCTCCEFKEDQPVDTEWIASVKKEMTPEKIVDDDKYNCLWIQPSFSKFCENTQKMSVFTAVYPDQETLNAYNFDLLTEQFVRSECKKDCCKQVILSHKISPKAFDFGSQGHHFARTHRDQAGNPLICLAISWYNTEHGQMKVFLDSDGDVGKYEWNEKVQCFDLQERLNVRCLNHTDPEEVSRMDKALWFDDGLRFLYSQHCPSLEQTIFFCWHTKDGRTRKYIFNPVSLQFSVVKCSCCPIGMNPRSTQISQDGTVAAYNSYTTQTQVLIKKSADGGLEKEMITYTGSAVTMEKSPIRIDSHLNSTEIIRRQEIERKVSHLTQLFTAEGHEGWVIRTSRTSSDGRSSIGTIALMDGSVKPFSLDCARQNFAIYHPDCVDLRSRQKFEKQNNIPNTERYALDWDLTPKSFSNCSHSKKCLIKAYNHFTEKTGFYAFNSNTGLFTEVSGCDECTVNSTLIGPNQVIHGSTSSLCDRAIIISTNGEGRLMKIGEDSKTKVFSGMAPLKVASKVEVKVEKNVSRVDRNVILNRLETQKNVPKKVEPVKVEEKPKEVELKVEAAPTPQLPYDATLTDFDLIPSFRNYCPHTGHFLITALNTKNNTTGHYVFNPTTALFHHQDYCPKCPNHESGVKIQKFVTIMPVETPKSSYPYLVMTNDDGRMVKIGFDPEIKGFVSMSSTIIQRAVSDIRNIENSMRPTPAKSLPVNQTGFMDTDLVPSCRVFCTHSSEFHIYGYHNKREIESCYTFNSLTGHLEERVGCPSCKATNPIYNIDTMRSIMPVMSPYSKWPTMLTTDKNGMLVPIAFKISNHRFDAMQSLKIVTLEDQKKKNEEIEAAEKMRQKLKEVYEVETQVVEKEEKVQLKIEVKEEDLEEDEYSDEEEEDEDEEEYEEEEEEEQKKPLMTPETKKEPSEEKPEEEEDDCSDEEEWCCSDEECDCSDEECSDEEECDCSGDECDCDCEDEDEEEEEEQKEEKEETKKDILKKLGKMNPDNINTMEDVKNVAILMEKLYSFDRKKTSNEDPVEEKASVEDDAESTATAIEDDLESTATAIEDDLESTATAIEDASLLDEDIVDHVDSSEDSDDLEILYHGRISREELSQLMNETTRDDVTALSTENAEKDEDALSTVTALEPSDDESDVSHVDAEPDVSDNDSDVPDDVSVISSTSTAIEYSIPRGSVSSMGSDISYLDNDLGSITDDNDHSEMVKSTYEDAPEEEEKDQPANEDTSGDETAAAPQNPCVIS